MGFGVKREVVFAALRAKKIYIAPVADAQNLYEIVAPSGEISTECIPPELGRREPQRLADLYDIPVQWFYTPLMIPGEEDKRKPS